MPHRRARSARAPLLLTVTLAALVLMLTACTPEPAPSGATAAAPILRARWQLSSARDSSGRIDLTGLFVTLTIADSSHTEVQTPCGVKRVSVRGGLGAIFVSTSRATSGAECAVPDQVGFDERFFGALGRARVASFIADSLVLSAPKVQLEFVRAQSIDLEAEQGSQWKLTDIERTLGPQQRNVPLDGDAIVTLSSPSRFTVATACYVSSGSFDTNGALYSVRDGTSSPRPCAASAVSVDSALAEVIYGSPFTITIHLDRMVLETAARTAVLSFQRLPTARLEP